MHSNMLITDYSQRSCTKRKKRIDDINFWINSTFSFLLWLIAVCFIYLIWSLNVWATQWYDIRELEVEKQNLLIEKEQLETKISTLESFDTIRNSKSYEKMEKIESPDFIVIRNWINYAYNN